MALSSYCHGYLRKKLRIKSLNCGPHKKPIYFAAPFRSCSKRNLVKENGLRVSINFRYWHIFGEPRLTIFFFFFPLFIAYSFFQESNVFYYCSKRGFSFFYSDVDEDVEPTFFLSEQKQRGILLDLKFFSRCFLFFILLLFFQTAVENWREKERIEVSIRRIIIP